MKNTIHNFDAQMKYQKYSHYLLPIAINPLNYGKLIEQFGDKYIIQLNTSNILVIKVSNNENFIRFFRKGDLMIEFTDKKISDIKFTRTISDQRFTFEKNKLITTEILGLGNPIKIFTTQEIVEDSVPVNPLNTGSIFDWIDNSKDPLKAFLIWELCLILVILIFVILLDQFLNIDNNNLTLGTMSMVSIIKLRKTRSRNVWDILILNFGKKVFSGSLFGNKFNKFWKDIQSGFNDNNYLFILFKIKYVNGEFVTIGKLQKLNLADKNWYINWIIDNMEFKSEYYNETQIESLIFSYGFKKGANPNKNESKPTENTMLINDIRLPISLNPEDYGKLINKIVLNDSDVYFLQSGNNIAITLRKFKEYNLVEFFKNGNCLINFRDEIISENKFVRLINNKKYYFEDGKQFLFTNEIKNKFIAKTNKTKTNKNNFITLDIETFVKDNILTPFCISIFDGKNISNFYLSDYKNVGELIITALESIMIRKYNGYNVYMHNMAKFDIIFLFKYLLKLGLVKPVIHNNKIILIDFKFGPNNKYNLKFKDSLLLLLNSLNKLCKSFKVNNSKTIFPIFFVNENNLNYIGNVPGIKHFKSISEKDYASYKTKFANNNWNLRNEVVKYCNLDCISLHQVLSKFNEMIFSLFSENIHHYPTLPSLAFAIFRSNFMDNENIPQLSGKIANDIRSGYTGGATDMYIPKSNKKIKCLDVNSLYPYIMESKLMPVGIPTFFNGNIIKKDPDAFGFFYCEIIAPDDIKHPIIQTHVKTNPFFLNLSFMWLNVIHNLKYYKSF
jgi:DNA polymerase type B, organellar and viral